MKKYLTAFITLCLPNWLKIRLLNMMGHKIHLGARIGMSIVIARRIYMDDRAVIGNFNIIRVNKILMRKKASIRTRNRIRGPINILMGPESTLSVDNSVYRADPPICVGHATLKFGRLGQIISKNHLDLTRSIEIGDYTTVGGLGAQFWTHGFFHSRRGRRRVRIDGVIKIGNNCYIGSCCVFNPGVSIGDGRLLENGTRAPLHVKVGDHVLFSSYAGETFKIDDEELLLMREDEILAVIEE